jgi:hypothetical protein
VSSHPSGHGAGGPSAGYQRGGAAIREPSGGRIGNFRQGARRIFLRLGNDDHTRVTAQCSITDPDSVGPGVRIRMRDPGGPK